MKIWNKLNSETNPIMLFSYETNFQDSAQIDYKAITGNVCIPFNGFNSYNANGQIFHVEQVGCNGTGVDYTVVDINRQNYNDVAFWNYDPNLKFFNISGNFLNNNGYPVSAETKKLYIFIK